MRLQCDMALILARLHVTLLCEAGIPLQFAPQLHVGSLQLVVTGMPFLCSQQHEQDIITSSCRQHIPLDPTEHFFPNLQRGEQL